MESADVLLLGVAGLFLITGAVKVVGVPQSLAIRDHLGLDPRAWRAIGALESAGAVGAFVGLWVPWLGRLALIGLAALMVGAIVSRLKVHDPVKALAVDVAVLAVVVVTVVMQAT